MTAHPGSDRSSPPRVAPIAVPAGGDGRSSGGRSPGGAGGGPRRRNRRSRRSFTLLRTLPHDSPIHRLWAGTKLVAVAVLGVVLSLRPFWSVIALVAAAVVFAGLLARIPRGAIPRPPGWFWVMVLVGAVLTLLSGMPPVVHVAGASVGLGGLELFIQFSVFGLVLLAASALVGWTTPLAEVAPALSRLGTPLRWLRLPVDEWAVAVALCVRTLPLLGDELRTLLAARRLRPRPGTGARRWMLMAVEPIDLLTAVLAVAIRRGAELAQALDGRGGVRLGPTGSSPGRGDVVALALVGVVAVGALIVPA